MADLIKLTYCSFCGRHDADPQMERMVLGRDNSAICNECIALCVDIIEDNRPDEAEAN